MIPSARTASAWNAFEPPARATSPMAPPQPSRLSPRRWVKGRGRRLPVLSLRVRVLVAVVGWALVLVGIAGLFLPGIQGILTMVAGAAVLSLASDRAYRWMRRALRRWPRAWRRVEKLRLKLHSKLSRW